MVGNVGYNVDTNNNLSCKSLTNNKKKGLAPEKQTKPNESDGINFLTSKRLKEKSKRGAGKSDELSKDLFPLSPILKDDKGNQGKNNQQDFKKKRYLEGKFDESSNSSIDSQNLDNSIPEENEIKLNDSERLTTKNISPDFFDLKKKATKQASNNSTKVIQHSQALNIEKALININTQVTINDSSSFSKKKEMLSSSKSNIITFQNEEQQRSHSKASGLESNKINSYFKNNQGNLSFNSKTDGGQHSSSFNTNLLLEDLNRLRQELEHQKKISMEKEIEMEQLKFKINEYDQKYKNILNELESTFESKDRTTESLVVYLRELEEMKRAKSKEWVNNQGFKIGKFKSHSQGLGMCQMWEDGVEVKSAKLELEKINRDKEEEKKAKRKINSTNYDKMEEYKFKIEKLNKAESDIKDKLVKYYKERVILEAEDRRLNEENKCNYMKKNWPILNKRYLILSLIGKGGYSEVYKAYDLIQHINVACKIHQLDQSWSEGVKELYIRHTIRENQIHQKINHEKVVKHFDTVEIDNNSFATVLELCSGPDLSFYIKQNGHLSEREAKIIIKQIIIGLKELHRQGIIHYDLKPQNIIFHKGEVKISDFGLAKDMADKDKIELTCKGVGTYYYLPPESFDPNRNSLIDQKVDIWSVGVIFYELLYGLKPFGHNMSQDRILKDNLIWSSKPVEFPSDNKITISKETQVS